MGYVLIWMTTRYTPYLIRFWGGVLMQYNPTAALGNLGRHCALNNGSVPFCQNLLNGAWLCMETNTEYTNHALPLAPE